MFYIMLYAPRMQHPCPEHPGPGTTAPQPRRGLFVSSVITQAYGKAMTIDAAPRAHLTDLQLGVRIFDPCNLTPQNRTLIH